MIFLIFFQQLLISEVMYNPNASEHHNEFIEIYNNTDNSILFSKFFISDGSDTDKVILYKGSELIKKNSFFLILDRDYVEKSDYYNDLIPDSVSLFIIDDSSIGQNGLSNSKAEKVSLLNEANELIDSVTYLIDKNKAGFSYERKIRYGRRWKFSLSERGSPGYHNTIDVFEKPFTISFKKFSKNKIHYKLIFTGEDEVESLKFTIKFDKFSFNKFVNYKNIDIKLKPPPLNSPKLYLTNEPDLDENHQYRVSVNMGLLSSDTLVFLKMNNRFPVIIDYLRLKKPQKFRVRNNLGNAFLLEKIFLNKSGKYKEIIVNKVLSDNLYFSKNQKDVDIFSPEIPILNSKNGKLKIKVDNYLDSLEYRLNKLMFYNPDDGVVVNKLEAFNHQSVWIANPYKSDLIDKRRFIFKLNSKHFNAETEQLIISLNYSEFDLIELKVYSINGLLIRNLSDGSVYKGIGNWFWDGKSAGGKKCGTGVYIVLLKARNKYSGELYIKKKAFVLYRK